MKTHSPRSPTATALLVIAAALPFASCASNPRATPPDAATTCALRASPRVILEDGAPDLPGSRRLAVWDIPDDPVLWTTARPSSPSLDAFLDEARRRVGDVSPATLLERASSPPTSAREVELNRMLLARLDELVVPMRCFDALLLARQTERLDMITSPTEVLAFVFRSADRTRLRVVEYTVNQPGIGRIGPMMDELDAALTAGWHPWSAFHNHNFFFGDESWHGGSVAPSAPDSELMAALHAERGLEESWITNGFSTSILPLRELPR